MILRGHAEVIHSDCGGNIVAGNNELKVNMNQMSSESINKYMVREAIEWKFNPPTAFHIAGGSMGTHDWPREESTSLWLFSQGLSHLQMRYCLQYPVKLNA